MVTSMRLPRSPAAVIFDMDGLLFDSERLYGQAILTAAAEVGCPMSHDIFLQLVGRSREVNHAFLLGHYGADYPLETLIAAWGRHFRELAATGLPLKTGAVALLERRLSASARSAVTGGPLLRSIAVDTVARHCPA